MSVAAPAGHDHVGRHTPPWPTSPFKLYDVPLALALAAVVVVAPRSVAEARWTEHLESLQWLALAGLAVGVVLARARLTSTMAHVVALALGVEAVLWAYTTAAPPGPIPGQVEWLLRRLATWVQVVLEGTASTDTLAFAMAMGALAWLLGYASAWFVFRAEAPWLAITSNALALAMNLSYAPPAPAGSVVWLVAASLALLAVHTVANRHGQWQMAGLSVERGVPLTVLGASFAAGIALVAAAALLPPGGTHTKVAQVWQRATTPWRELERGMDRLFSSLQGSESATRGLNFGRSLAPRGAFELGDTPVLEVTSSAPRYWRATTMDRYTRQAFTSSDTVDQEVAADELLAPAADLPDSRVETVSTVKVLASRSVVSFAPEVPVRLSVPVQLATRGGAGPLPDVAGMRFTAPLLQGQEYTVVSAASVASVQELRAAGQNYPAWVRERYLQLPRGLPPRVIERSAELTHGIIAAYDRAIIIESYLRSNYRYTTQVPAMPADRDWVEYILFEAEEGYCDFFAAAMVVMLRTQGVPARVASGFAPGDRDPDVPNRWIVRENHAHSWVEAYFPRYGWIIFEPSAIRPLPERLNVPPPRLPEAPPPPPRTDAANTKPLTQDELRELRTLSGDEGSRALLPAWVGIVLWSLAGLLLVALLCAGLLVYAWRRGVAGLHHYQRAYVELLRLARWVGVAKPRVSQTPFEVADVVVREVPEETATIRGLADAYVAGTFSMRQPAASSWSDWAAARRRVATALVRRRLRRVRRPPRR